MVGSRHLDSRLYLYKWFYSPGIYKNVACFCCIRIPATGAGGNTFITAWVLHLVVRGPFTTSIKSHTNVDGGPCQAPQYECEYVELKKQQRKREFAK